MRNLARGALAVLSLQVAVVMGCGGGQASSSGSTTPNALAGSEPAHRLVVAANACWLGGLWGDALGEQGGLRGAGEDARCEDAVRAVYGKADDRAQWEKLRALDDGAVDAFVAKVGELASRDEADGAHKDALVSLARASAAAERELLVARRAANAIHEDTDRDDVTKLSIEQVNAVPALRAHAALEALLTLDAGDLSKEAHALGLLCVVDRFSFARGIPRHMKVYAIEEPLKLVFGVEPPPIPGDPSTALVHTELLDYMTRAASAAGHPVPEGAGANTDKYALAYAGVLDGVADKLRADESGIAATTDLKKVVEAVAGRLAAREERTRGGG